jgi:hypothetical protein
MPRRSASGHERQVRLLPQFAEMYPGILAGVWMPAWVVLEQVSQTAAEGAGESSGERTCDPRHFQFRGGLGRPPELRHLRTRTSDQPSGS